MSSITSEGSSSGSIKIETTDDNTTAEKPDVCSKLATFQVSYTWTIGNFSSHLNGTNFKPIVSPKIALPGNEDIQFEIELYPNGENEATKEWLALYLSCIISSKAVIGPLQTMYKISILDQDGKHQLSEKESDNFGDGDSNGWSRFVTHAYLLKPKHRLLANNQLRIHCEAAGVYDCVLCCSCCKLVTDNSLVQEKYTEAMKRLLQTGTYSDAILSVGDTVFPVHKALLSAHSPVFAAMFDTKEAQEAKVIISDISADTFQVLLCYIYTGQVPPLEQLTSELLSAADKYQLVMLKGLCEKYLSESLSIDSVATMLLFADMHSAVYLKEHCINFITVNYNKVMLSDAWKTMAMARPALFVEACRNLAMKTGQGEQQLEGLKKMKLA